MPRRCITLSSPWRTASRPITTTCASSRTKRSPLCARGRASRRGRSFRTSRASPRCRRGTPDQHGSPSVWPSVPSTWASGCSRCLVSATSCGSSCDRSAPLLHGVCVPVGSAIRRLLGPHQARRAGRWYRGIFVDLGKEAAALASAIPRDAHLLDVGGGDGEPLNRLLALRADLRITTLDTGPVVGQWLENRFAAQVVRLPGMSLADYVAERRP